MRMSTNACIHYIALNTDVYLQKHRISLRAVSNTLHDSYQPFQAHAQMKDYSPYDVSEFD